VARIVEVGALTPVPEHESQAFLLPRYWQPGIGTGRCTTPYAIGPGLQAATGRSTRTGYGHSFATEMVRLGVSLPALMQMMDTETSA